MPSPPNPPLAVAAGEDSLADQNHAQTTPESLLVDVDNVDLENNKSNNNHTTSDSMSSNNKPTTATNHTTTTNDDSASSSPPPVGPVEPYLTLAEIAALHPASHIVPANPAQSGGLSAADAAARLETYGPNALTPPTPVPEWQRFVQQFRNLFVLLLLACAVLSLFSYLLLDDVNNLYLAIVLFVVATATALGRFYQEGTSRKSMAESFGKMVAAECTVVRDGGREQTLAVAQLVPGDVVLIRNGDIGPADCVLLQCRNLKSENSSLTGESKPLAGRDKPPAPAGTPLTECPNVVFQGSLCFDGTAIALVVRTGDATAIGTIARLASDDETSEGESPLQTDVRLFVQLVAIIAVSMALVAFVISVFVQGATTWDEILRLFVNGFLVILVANIPQGLPSTVVSLLSLAARHMAQRSVLVKRLESVETLGSVSLICSDKTGTLTKNIMTVTDLWYNQRLTGSHDPHCGQSLHAPEPQSVLYRCAVICNRGQAITEEEQNLQWESQRESLRLRAKQVSRLSWGDISARQLSVGSTNPLPVDDVRRFAGNPSDVALLTYVDNRTPHSVAKLRDEYPILFEVPFNSTNKWHLVVARSVVASNHLETIGENDDVEYQVLMKGAPEVMLNRCTTFASTHQATHFQDEITDEFRRAFSNTYQAFSKQGRRVLAFCSTTFRAPRNMEFAESDEEEGVYNFPTTGLNFIGMVAIMDPPRDNVPDSISMCHAAGVKVFMVTGDHPFTAKAIAIQIGLLRGENNIELLEDHHSHTTTPLEEWEKCDGAIVHGTRVDALTDEQWRLLLSRKGGVCFARTTPAHKRLIVLKAQTLMGETVAVTGDGVNDAPALRQADIGVAMGLNGSAVAQDAADILLMDDNFASIVSGIEEGRIIFDNIKKTIAYTMAHIFPEVVSALLALLAGLPAGLTALQVLTIDLGTELGAAISLAYEEPESDIMKRKPRNPHRDRLVSPVLLSYSYLVAGGMITIGCMLSYTFTYWQNDIRLSDFYRPGLNGNGGDFFSLTSDEPVTIERTGITYSPEEQQSIFSQGATAYYVTLTVAQLFGHIWACKTRLHSLFQHGFSNTLTFYGVAFGLVVVVFFTYIPGVQSFVGSTQVGWIPWMTAVITGSVIFAYSECAKWYFRRSGPNNPIVRAFAW